MTLGRLHGPWCEQTPKECYVTTCHRLDLSKTLDFRLIMPKNLPRALRIWFIIIIKKHRAKITAESGSLDLWKPYLYTHTHTNISKGAPSKLLSTLWSSVTKGSHVATSPGPPLRPSTWWGPPVQPRPSTDIETSLPYIGLDLLAPVIVGPQPL